MRINFDIFTRETPDVSSQIRLKNDAFQPIPSHYYFNSGRGSSRGGEVRGLEIEAIVLELAISILLIHRYALGTGSNGEDCSVNNGIFAVPREILAGELSPFGAE